MGTVVRIADPLVGWQEIDEADQAEEHDLLADLFRPGGHRRDAEHGTLARSFATGYRHAGFGTAVPISVPPGLTLEQSKATQVSPGRSRAEAARVHTAATPQRVVVQALLSVDELPDFPAFVDLNGHLPFKVPDLWTEAHKGWRAVAAEWSGRTVLTQRDTNRHGAMPKLAGDERQLLPGDGIDRISRMLGEGRQRLLVKVVRRRTVRLTIDGHNAQGVLVRLVDPRTTDAVQLWVVSCNIGRHVSQREARANIALVRRGFRQAA